MRGEPKHTFVFKTADGWARRVLASTPLDAAKVLADEILNAERCSFHAYRPAPPAVGSYTDSRRLDKFHLTDFISCLVEH